jgi:prepilin-type N-terminal cleavage/methylation domain-containing protein
MRSLRLLSAARAFTLLEVLLVIAIIALVAVFLLPSLGTGSARNLDGASRQFAADLENARLIAMAERTRTRVLLPAGAGDFSNMTASATPWPNDITRRGYVIASEKRTETMWKQRGKWNRFPQGVAFSAFVQPSPTPIPAAMAIDVSGTSSHSYDYNGAYIEFLANGSCSLDPAASPAPGVTVADGFIDSNGNFAPKNRGLVATITIDPLSGSVSLK